MFSCSNRLERDCRVLKWKILHFVGVISEEKKECITFLYIYMKTKNSIRLNIIDERRLPKKIFRPWNQITN